MFGIFVVDKSAGIVCQKILSRFRSAFPKIKVGYTGTLDPFATGVLPVFLGEATKLIPQVHEEHKLYRATLKLGEATSTLDSESPVIQTASVPLLLPEKIEQVLKSFLGERLQTPPLYSAVKIQGKPLYRYARSGKSLPEPVTARSIRILSIELIGWEPPFLEWEVRVSRGTYVRVLGEEIAKQLGSVGHLTSLRRLESGPFNLTQSIPTSLDEFLKLPQTEIFRFSLNPRSLLSDFVLFEADPAQVFELRHGRVVFFDHPLWAVGQKVMVTENEQLIALTVFLKKPESSSISPFTKDYLLQPTRLFNSYGS